LSSHLQTNTLPCKQTAAAANCVDKRACDEPEGLFPTKVDSKACTDAAPPVCTCDVVPVVQAFFASK
jgi:hypothetical protein